MSSFFNYDKEKSNGFLISLTFAILILIIPNYIKFLFSKGPQSSIPNISKLLPQGLVNSLNGIELSNKNFGWLLTLNETQFMSNPIFSTPIVILLSLVIFMTIQFSFQYNALKNECSDKMKKNSIIPIFGPLIGLFLLLIFGFTSQTIYSHTLSFNLIFAIVSIIYFILMNHTYYKWDTSSWLAPIISLLIAYLIKFSFDFGINSENKIINWILIFFVFIMGSNLYSSYYSYSLALNQQKICKTI